MRFRHVMQVLLILALTSVGFAQQPTAETKPHWAGEPVPEGAVRFKFSIITDRHGGRKPGSTVLAEAVEEINLLDPDLTISIGDLINGYTDDMDEIKKQWDEFDRDIQKLKRPFYYVFGNHDSSNAAMEKLLRKRYGSPYYSFNHKNCHFIVLFTESRNEVGGLLGRIDDEQIEWLKRDLAANPKADHYFLFMHKPYTYDKAWEQVEALFEGKQLTVFTGHWHHYHQKMQKGHNYMVLSSTGGGIDPKNFWGGQFYHHVQVTVTGREVSIALLRVGATLPHDLLNDEFLNQLTRLRETAANLTYEVPRGVSKLDHDLVIALANPLPTPMIGACDWQLPADSPWEVSPTHAEFIIEPGQTSQLKFRLKLATDPFRVDLALAPRYTLAIRSGRCDDSHTPYDRGRDTVVDVQDRRLALDRWPYSATVATLRKGLDIEPVIAGEEPVKVARTMTLTNRLDTPMAITLVWTNRNPAWSIKPGLGKVRVAPGGTAQLDFEVTCNGKGLDVVPAPRLTLTASADGQLVLTETRPLAVDLRAVLANYAPTSAVGRLAAAPKIDGRLDEPAWKDAGVLGRFFDIDGMGEAPFPTEVRLGRTRKGLYVGIDCYEPDMANVAAQERSRDGNVFRDDFVELFVDSNFDRLSYYHLTVNPMGSIYDATGRRGSDWNGRWRSAVTRRDHRWIVEIFIPWSDLGGRPRRGAKMGFNVARRRPDRPPGPPYTFWSPTLKGDSHIPERFGILSFP